MGLKLWSDCGHDLKNNKVNRHLETGNNGNLTSSFAHDRVMRTVFYKSCIMSHQCYPYKKGFLINLCYFRTRLSTLLEADRQRTSKISQKSCQSEHMAAEVNRRQEEH